MPPWRAWCVGRLLLTGVALSLLPCPADAINLCYIPSNPIHRHVFYAIVRYLNTTRPDLTLNHSITFSPVVLPAQSTLPSRSMLARMINRYRPVCDIYLGLGYSHLYEKFDHLFSVPIIDFTATSPVLANPRLFPLLSRVTPSDSDQASLLRALLIHLGWDQIILVYSLDTYGRAFLRRLTSSCKLHHPVNDHGAKGIITKEYGLRFNADRADIDELVDKLGNDTSSRIIVLASTLLENPYFLHKISNHPVKDSHIFVGTDALCMSQPPRFFGMICFGHTYDERGIYEFITHPTLGIQQPLRDAASASQLNFTILDWGLNSTKYQGYDAQDWALLDHNDPEGIGHHSRLKYQRILMAPLAQFFDALLITMKGVERLVRDAIGLPLDVPWQRLPPFNRSHVELIANAPMVAIRPEYWENGENSFSEGFIDGGSNKVSGADYHANLGIECGNETDDCTATSLAGGRAHQGERRRGAGSSPNPTRLAKRWKLLATWRRHRTAQAGRPSEAVYPDPLEPNIDGNDHFGGHPDTNPDQDITEDLEDHVTVNEDEWEASPLAVSIDNLTISLDESGLSLTYPTSSYKDIILRSQIIAEHFPTLPRWCGSMRPDSQRMAYVLKIIRETVINDGLTGRVSLDPVTGDRRTMSMNLLQYVPGGKSPEVVFISMSYDEGPTDPREHTPYGGRDFIQPECAQNSDRLHIPREPFEHKLWWFGRRGLPIPEAVLKSEIDDRHSPEVLIALIISSFFLLTIIFALLVVAYKLYLARKSIMASNCSDIAVVTMSVASAELLWAKRPRTMRQCTTILEDIYRRLALSFKGEVIHQRPGEGALHDGRLPDEPGAHAHGEHAPPSSIDSITILFSNTSNALKFAISLQEDLLLAPWPPDIASINHFYSGTTSGNRGIFRSPSNFSASEHRYQVPIRDRPNQSPNDSFGSNPLSVDSPTNSLRNPNYTVSMNGRASGIPKLPEKIMPIHQLVSNDGNRVDPERRTIGEKASVTHDGGSNAWNGLRVSVLVHSGRVRRASPSYHAGTRPDFDEYYSKNDAKQEKTNTKAATPKNDHNRRRQAVHDDVDAPYSDSLAGVVFAAAAGALPSVEGGQVAISRDFLRLFRANWRGPYYEGFSCPCTRTSSCLRACVSFLCCSFSSRDSLPLAGLVLRPITTPSPLELFSVSFSQEYLDRLSQPHGQFALRSDADSDPSALSHSCSNIMLSNSDLANISQSKVSRGSRVDDPLSFQNPNETRRKSTNDDASSPRRRVAPRGEVLSNRIFWNVNRDSTVEPLVPLRRVHRKHPSTSTSSNNNNNSRITNQTSNMDIQPDDKPAEEPQLNGDFNTV